jgi:hypothetical protein
MYLIGAVLTGLFGFAYFGLLNTAVPALIFIATMLSFVPHDLMYGPLAALIAECFTPRLQHSGSSIGYQLEQPSLMRLPKQATSPLMGVNKDGIGPKGKETQLEGWLVLSRLSQACRRLRMR